MLSEEFIVTDDVFFASHVFEIDLMAANPRWSTELSWGIVVHLQAISLDKQIPLNVLLLIHVIHYILEELPYGVLTRCIAIITSCATTPDDDGFSVRPCRFECLIV